jgi:hypothetical protein
MEVFRDALNSYNRARSRAGVPAKIWACPEFLWRISIRVSHRAETLSLRLVSVYINTTNTIISAFQAM